MSLATESNNNSDKHISLKNFFIFNSTFGLNEGEVSLDSFERCLSVITIDLTCYFRKNRRFSFIIRMTQNWTQKSRMLDCVRPSSSFPSKPLYLAINRNIIIDFDFLLSSTFTLDDSCHCLRTQKTVQVYHQAEKDFWMVLVIDDALTVIRFDNPISVLHFSDIECTK